jgi:hypothetical protein
MCLNLLGLSMFVIFVLAVKNQGFRPCLLTDGHVANSPACSIKSRALWLSGLLRCCKHASLANE